MSRDAKSREFAVAISRFPRRHVRAPGGRGEEEEDDREEEEEDGGKEKKRVRGIVRHDEEVEDWNRTAGFQGCSV